VKRFLTVSISAIMVAAALFTLAFGPRPRPLSAQGRVHVLYWEKWTGLEGQQAQQVVNAFNNTIGKEKGIWVDMTSMSQIDRKTLISTAAGCPPDIAGLWDGQVLQFASMNALEPLDGYAQQYSMTRDKYKPVYYDGCKFNNTLYAIPSTVWCIALLWNKAVFQEKAAEIRTAGLDPDRAPRTIDELDKYAAAIDTWEGTGKNRRLKLTGYIPLEPGTATNEMGYWFGAPIADPTGTRVLLNSPQMMATYDWIRGYSERLGAAQLAEFRSGFSAGATSLFDTPQNPFLVGWNAMVAQGPWMAAFIEKYDPQFDRWHVPENQLKRESDFALIHPGMTLDEVRKVLGKEDSQSPDGTLHWRAGIKDIDITIADGKVAQAACPLLPAEERKKYCQWGAAPFPSAVSGLNDVTYAGMDVWVIPSTARHKKEAFEFIAFASRQDQIEKLASLHYNLSPLKDESRQYRDSHPNAYVDVYEKLASSPNARALPRLVNWQQISDELTQAAERSYTLDGTTREILDQIQGRAQKELNKVLGVPDETNLAMSGPGN
jgi:ABC-type glycerol-3-phosphate transport system substrate-binding protein